MQEQNWEEMMKGQVFISDLGESPEVTVEGATAVLGRYAVWSPVSEGTGHQVIEVGEDLAALCEKYDVPPARVCSLVGHA